MVISDDMVTLDKKEVKELIDKECRKRFGLTTKEFLRERKEGKLISSAAHDIEILLKIA